MKKLPLLLLLCFSPYVAGEGLPDLGDVSQRFISPAQERQIGLQSLLQIRASSEFLDDTEVNDYLNDIGGKLVDFSSEPGHRFEFFAINDYSINAFAIPGGYVGVNVGLILTTQSESELASVLSHEISHVTQHHYARLLDAQQNNGLISVAAIVLAILAARDSSQATEATLAGSQAYAIQKQLDFTRANEQEADRIGLQLLEKSGFDTHAMPAFLERLQNATRVLDGNAPNYLRTHPVTSDRIAEIENRIHKQPYRLLPDSLDFQLVRTKLIAAQKSPTNAVSHFNDALYTQKFGNPIAQRYGLVRSLLRNNDIKRATAELDTLRKQAKNNPMIETLAGQVLRAAKSDQVTMAFDQDAVQNFPHHRALIYEYVDLLLQKNQAETAVKLRNNKIANDTNDAKLYALRARAYTILGKPLEQHQALAYSYYWQGDLRGAAEQLELAKQAGGNFYQLSSIESDIHELREILSEEKKN